MRLYPFFIKSDILRSINNYSPKFYWNENSLKQDENRSSTLLLRSKEYRKSQYLNMLNYGIKKI